MTIKLYSRWPSNLTTCPVTGGCPTRMLEERFLALCAKKQEIDESYCATTCRGTILPAELSFITLSKEIDMPSQNTAPGICCVCGERKNVKTVRDGKCCSNCSHIYHAVHGKGELLLTLLRRVHGDGWVADKIPRPAPSVESVVAPINDDSNEIVSLLRVGEKLRDDLDKLHREMELDKPLDEVVINGDGRVVVPSGGIVSPQQILDKRGHQLPIPVLSGALLEVSQSRADILLDLAIGVIDGRVVGIDANTINLLRQ